ARPADIEALVAGQRRDRDLVGAAGTRVRVDHAFVNPLVDRLRRDVVDGRDLSNRDVHGAIVINSPGDVFGGSLAPALGELRGAVARGVWQPRCGGGLA